MDFSIYVLLVVSLILLGLTLLLFGTALFVRYRHQKWTTKYNMYKDQILPKVLDYIDEGETEEFVDSLEGAKLEYYAIERIISDLLAEVEGNDADRLKELLYIQPIFDHHFKLLKSDNDPHRIKACNYFGNIRLINYKVIELLKEYVHSSNFLLAFSAASALMSSKDVSVRFEALSSIALNSNTTEMALLELLYKFHKEEGEQNEEEVELLKSLLINSEVSADNRALLIEGITEIGYYSMVGFLLELLKKPSLFGHNPLIFEAIIRAHGVFNNVESIPYLRQCLKSDQPKVIVAAVNELSDYGSTEDYPAFYNLLLHERDEVKEAALNALLSNNQSTEKLIRWAPERDKPQVKKLTQKFYTKMDKEES